MGIEECRAEIRIGGSLSRAQAIALGSQLREGRPLYADSLNLEPFTPGGADPTDETILADLIANAAAHEGWLWLCDRFAPGGRLEELETFLEHCGIPFDRHADAGTELDAELVQYRPEFGREEFMSRTNNEDVAIPAESLEAVIRELEDTRPAEERIAAAIGQIRLLQGKHIPALPHLHIRE